MQSPVPLELTKVGLGWLLIMNLKVIADHVTLIVSTTGPHLDLPEALSGEAKSELVATALVLEAIDAAESLSDGDIEDEVGEGEENDWDPAVAALEAWGLGLSEEDEREKDKEELKELPKLLLLEVNSSFLLQGLLEVELDDGVEGLKGCFFWDYLCHWR